MEGTAAPESTPRGLRERMRRAPLWGALPSGWVARLAHAGMLLVAYLAGLSFLRGFDGPVGLGMRGPWLVGALIATGLHLVAGQRAPGLVAALVRWGARMALLPFFAFIAYDLLLFGRPLWWAVPTIVKVSIVGLALAALATSRRVAGRLRVPFVLPAGVLVYASLSAWNTEDNTVRCQDVLAIEAQPAVSIVLPTADFSGCVPGRRVYVDGHPRKLFAAGGEGTYFLAVERASHTEGNEPTSTLRGGMCFATIRAGEPASEPTCHVEGTGYVVALRGDTGELYFAGDDGVFRMEAQAPWRVLAHHVFEDNVALGLVHRARPVGGEEVVVFFDNAGRGAVRVDPETLDVREAVPVPISPERTEFSADRAEGVHCWSSIFVASVENEPALAHAFGDDLLGVRALGGEGAVPWQRFAFSDGCAFDEASREVWSTVFTLPLVARMDYDSGAIEALHWAPFAQRPILVDPVARRLYTAGYFTGSLEERDLDSMELLRSWFVGRLVRELTFEAGGGSMLATTTAGVVRVDIR